ASLDLRQLQSSPRRAAVHHHRRRGARRTRTARSSAASGRSILRRRLMAIDQRRAEVAARLRALGHDFVARSLSDKQLDALLAPLGQLTEIVESAEVRVRTFPKVDLANFKMAVPREDQVEHHELFADSYVSGATNPLGLGAS